MNRTFAFTLFVLASLMLVTQVIAEPVTVDLIADGRAELPDQPIKAGTVTVSNDGTNLSVMYNLTLAPWLLGETHVAVGIMDADDNLVGIPMTGSGNPKVGKFPYSKEHDPITTPITQYEEKIPLADLETALQEALDDETFELLPGTEICVAAHAEIVIVDLVDGVLGIVEDETGWGDGEPFPGNNWATYIKYTIQEEEI